MQRRSLARPVQLRETPGAAPVITGYAAVFYRAGDPGTEFQLYPGCVERVMPTAFNRAIQESDPRGLFNHDANLILGRKSAGTLRLFVDDIGLRYEVDPPDTQAARDVLTLLRRGDITGSSFAFVPKYAQRDENGTHIMEVIDCDLYDVGPVVFPAYPATAAGVRADGSDIAAAKQAEDRWRAYQRDKARLSLAEFEWSCLE